MTTYHYPRVYRALFFSSFWWKNPHLRKTPAWIGIPNEQLNNAEKFIFQKIEKLFSIHDITMQKPPDAEKHRTQHLSCRLSKNQKNSCLLGWSDLWSDSERSVPNRTSERRGRKEKIYLLPKFPLHSIGLSLCRLDMAWIRITDSWLLVDIYIVDFCWFDTSTFRKVPPVTGAR